MRHPNRWIRRAVLTLWLLATAAGLALVSAAPAGFQNRRLTIIGEPEEHTSYIQFCKDGVQQDWAELQWVENGKNGQSIRLDGQGGYLWIGYDQLQLRQMTLSFWVNWQGAAASADTAIGQRLFTFYSGQNRTLSLSPWQQNVEMKKDGGSLNGLFLQFNENNRNMRNLFTPYKGGEATYALPQNEWHHIALVSDARSLKLYVDGVLWLQDQLVMSLLEMRMNGLMIGAGLNDEPTLNAFLDDIGLYDAALTEQQVLMLARGVENPFAQDAVVPPAPEEHIATRPPTTVTEPQTETTAAPTTTTVPSENNGTFYGVPYWAVGVIAGLVLLFILLSIVLSIYQKRQNGRGKH